MDAEWCPGQVNDPDSVSRKVACGAAEVVPFVRVTSFGPHPAGAQERGVAVRDRGRSGKSIYDNDLTVSMALVMDRGRGGLRRLYPGAVRLRGTPAHGRFGAA